MDILFKIWSFFGFLAFLQVRNLSIGKIKRDHLINSEANTCRSSIKDDMQQILSPYIGKEIETIEFYEDEEPGNFFYLKQKKLFLEDIDEKWALIKIITSKDEKQELIRMSSIKGIAFAGITTNQKKCQ